VKPGDRLKLTPKIAASAMRGMNSSLKRATRVDWTTRCGTITKIRYANATIQWDDRRSVDHWPVTALCEE
jgi:hypothetical protein